MTDDGAESDGGLVKPGEPLVLRVAPSKLAGALSLAVPRPLTPPNSLPDVVPETPELAKVHDVKVDGNVTPRSRSGGKKRELPNSPDEGLRHSPRNHSNTMQVGGDERVRKLHPLFMGKAARIYRHWFI
jgi:hypothetical protein